MPDNITMRKLHRPVDMGEVVGQPNREKEMHIVICDAPELGTRIRGTPSHTVFESRKYRYELKR